MTNTIFDFLEFHYSGTSGFISLWEPGQREAFRYFHTDNLEAAAAHVTEVAESSNVYFGVALRKEEYPGRRGKKNECSSVGALWLDIDIGTVGHKAKDLPPNLEAVRPLLRDVGLEPSAIIHSGGGLHPYYKLTSPFVINGPEDIARFERVNKALALRFVSAAMAAGYNADGQTYNLDRVLRIPGTVNHKEGLKRPVTAIGYSDARYVFEQLEEDLLNNTRPIAVTDDDVPLTGVLAGLDDPVKCLRKKLRYYKKDPHTAVLIKAMLKGEPFGDPGERDLALLKVCGVIGWFDCDTDAEELAEILRPSLSEWANEPNAQLSTEEELAKAVDKIARAQRNAFEQREIERKEEEKKAAKQQEEARKAGTSAKKRGPYTKEELEEFAAKQSCTVDEFQQRWIIQRGDAYYIFVNGKYMKPIRSKELLVSLPRDLSPAPVDFMRPGPKGPVEKTLTELLRDYATVARDVIADMTLKDSYYNPVDQTYYEAVCPLRDLKPKEHPEIGKWLELLGGEDADKLLDWVATITMLDRQTCALYLQGRPGVGKGMLANGLARLWIKGGPTQLGRVGQWTSSIARCPLVWADEHLPQSFKGEAMTANLRALIGTDRHTLSKKFFDDADLIGSVRAILSANNDRLLIASREELCKDDLDAVSKRILHIMCSDAPREYLESLGGRGGTEGWVDDDLIAEHALWLRDNRQVIPGNRFLVEGRETDMHRMMATIDKSGLACEWIIRHLDMPEPDANRHRSKPIIENGALYINASSVVDNWKTYMDGQEKPTVKRIGDAIRNISVGTKKFKGTSYHQINLDLVLTWAERNQIGNLDVIRKRLTAGFENNVVSLNK